MKRATLKHMAHCATFVFLVALFQIFRGTELTDVSPLEDYGLVLTIVLYIIQLLPLMSLPFMIENALGLLAFNAFKETVESKLAPQQAPFLCFRVVTRGDFPALVRHNVERNLQLCISEGLMQFSIEVVTDKPVGLPPSSKAKEVVVPASYRTRSGALYKGRALQYCLEAENNKLQDDDWIVHLDEETLLTRSAINGILNFVGDGQHQLGQGVISYANEEVINWLTTLMDSYRVAEDYGRIRWEIKAYHCPLSCWKGSFMVVLAGAERKISFDHGLKSSISEDNFFSMSAIERGYSFDFIEGEMLEKSPFTLWDFLQQRIRWMQGFYLLVHSSQIPFRIRIFGMIGVYVLTLSPLIPIIVMARHIFPLPGLWLVDAMMSFVPCTIVYLFLFGMIKSYNITKIGLPRFLLTFAGLAVAVPSFVVLTTAAVVLAICRKQQGFYIINKDYEKTIENGERLLVKTGSTVV